MSQPAVHSQQQSSPTSAPRLAAFAYHLPYVAFLVWMVYKQRAALLSTGIMPGPDMQLATAATLLAISPWFVRSPRRRRFLWAALLDLVITFIVFGDIIYFRQFGDLTSVASLRFVMQLTTVSDSVTKLLKPSDLWLWVDVPLIGALALVPDLSPERVWGRLQKTAIGLRTAGLLTLIGAVILGGIAFLDPMLKAKYYGHSNVASRLGLLNYHLFDVGEYLGRFAIRLVPSAPAVAETNQWFQPHRNLQPTTAPMFGQYKGKNVIVIQVESLQAFTLGLKVGGVEVTPNLNKLARESMNYTDFYSETGQGVTSDADLLANCSLYPTRTGAVYYDYAANDFRCTPWLLRQHGYTAVAMQGMPPDFWNLATVYPHVGFEKYYNIKDGLKLDEKVGIGLSDESFFKQVVPNLKQLQQPYYAFLVTLTSHGPFDFEGIPHELPLGALAGTDAGHYLDAVHYTDKAIGHFIEQAKAEGILDNAMVMVYGDHAGVFRTSSGIPQLLGIPVTDEAAWTRMEKRIPFLLRLPGGEGAGEQPHAAGQVDIAPTIAGLLGIPTDETYYFGRNLMQAPTGVVPFYTGSAMTDDLLFWAKADSPDGGTCYDRKTGAETDVKACAALAKETADDLRISRMVVERNLIPQLAAKK